MDNAGNGKVYQTKMLKTFHLKVQSHEKVLEFLTWDGSFSLTKVRLPFLKF
jgi:hypothetical protein